MNISSPPGMVDPDMRGPSSPLVEDLVTANRILAHMGVLDAFGHVSARHDQYPNRFLLARNVAPGQVTSADIHEFTLAGEPVNETDVKLYVERFIHGSIYRARPDVIAIVHSHSTAVVPFTLTRKRPMRPVCHMSGFLGAGSPLFEIRNAAGSSTDLLIRDDSLGRALAESLGDANLVLMRGHGCTTVAPSLKLAVYRSVYAEINARIQFSALQLGDPEYLTPQEAEAAMASTESQIERPWELWKLAALGPS